MADAFLKVGDTSPALEFTLWKGSSATPVSLTGATIKLIVSFASGPQPFDCVIVNASAGKAKYVPVGTEFTQRGLYRAEIEVTFADLTKGTFPNDGYFTIKVTDDLN